MKKIHLLITLLFALIIITNAQNTSPYWSLAGNSNATTSSKLGTTNNISLRFYTNNVQRMIINSASGLVGIGTTTPTERLHINSSAGTNAFRVQVNTFTKFLVHGGGGVSVGSGSTPPPNGLYVSGSVGIGINTLLAGKLDVRTTSNFTAINASTEQGNGVRGFSTEGYGVVGNSNQGTGVYGYSNNVGVKAAGQVYGVDASGDYTGVNCFSADGVGLNANSTTSIGVYGSSRDSYGGNFESYNSTGIVASSANGTYAGEFNGKVYASAGYVTSDKNLKQNIREFEDALSIINKLKPQNYEFKKDTKYSFLHLPKGSHYGLMAQDLEQILPNLVSVSQHEVRTVKPSPGVAQQQTKESITIKAVNYAELIPVMIKGMQEQQIQIEKLSVTNETLQKEIDELKSLISKISNGGSTTSSTGYLKQNVPNPAGNNTVISYYLPDNSGQAQIRVTDSKGRALKVYTAKKGDGQVNIKSGEFTSGIYTYTLYVNDKKIDSKQMIIIK
jgi:hypothetical protein